MIYSNSIYWKFFDLVEIFRSTGNFLVYWNFSIYSKIVDLLKFWSISWFFVLLKLFELLEVFWSTSKVSNVLKDFIYRARKTFRKSIGYIWPTPHSLLLSHQFKVNIVGIFVSYRENSFPSSYAILLPIFVCIFICWYKQFSSRTRTHASQPILCLGTPSTRNTKTIYSVLYSKDNAKDNNLNM